MSTLRRVQLALATLMCLSLLLWPARPAAAQTTPALCTSGYALWADGRSGDEILAISGSSNTVAGATRSNADLRISGSSNSLSEGSRVEYGSAFQDGGDQNRYPTPTRVAASEPPVSYNIAAYRPGGAQAAAAQAAGLYTQITGDLDVSEPRALSGLYYVTGDAKLSASNITGAFTVVAEGAIDVSGSQIRATPYADGLLLFAAKREVGASVIKLAGSDSDLSGVIYGPGGTVELSGSNSRIAGVVLGLALKLNGSSLRISFDSQHCPGAPPAEEEERRSPPAEIRIGDDDVTRRVEVVGGATLITIQITIRNTGGQARDTRLVIDLGRGRGGDDDDDDDDDDRFDLSEVRFIEGTGYVRERSGARIVIGVGQYNVIRNRGPIVVSVTYRLRDGVRDDDGDDDGRINFAADARLIYSDSGGTRTVVLPPLVVVVPVVVIPVVPVIVEVPRLAVERIDVRFRGVWTGRGGLPIFGLPLTEPITRTDGTLVQIFERARLELRPGGQVQFGRLAAELGYLTPPSVRPDDLDDDDRRFYFGETGHVIGAPFRGYWSGRGGIVIFGLPISGLTVDAAGLETQCFERACMQVFPALAGTENAIQLRLLGVELIARGGDDDDD